MALKRQTKYPNPQTLTLSCVHNSFYNLLKILLFLYHKISIYITTKNVRKLKIYVTLEKFYTAF